MLMDAAAVAVPISISMIAIKTDCHLFGCIKTLVALMICHDLLKYSISLKSNFVRCESVAAAAVKCDGTGGNISDTWPLMPSDDRNNDLLSATMFTTSGWKDTTKVSTDMVLPQKVTIQSSASSTSPSSLSSSSAKSTSSARASSEFRPSPSSLQQRLLSRPKRYLSFPEGSSFSVCSSGIECMCAGLCMCV